jgi:hypothetical protein
VADPYCGGFKVDWDKCNLRYQEMKLAAFQPIECTTGEIPGCKELVAYARFNIKK